MSEINDPECGPGPAYDPMAAAVGMRAVAWAAVRERQSAGDLTGLILAQMALELIDGAARQREHDTFMRARAEPFDSGGPPIPALACAG